MESKTSDQKINDSNIINTNLIPIEDERKKIISNIIKKSVQCSKTTIELTSIIS